MAGSMPSSPRPRGPSAPSWRGPPRAASPRHRAAVAAGDAAANEHVEQTIVPRRSRCVSSPPENRTVPPRPRLRIGQEAHGESATRLYQPPTPLARPRIIPDSVVRLDARPDMAAWPEADWAVSAEGGDCSAAASSCSASLGNPFGIVKDTTKEIPMLRSIPRLFRPFDPDHRSSGCPFQTPGCRGARAPSCRPAWGCWCPRTSILRPGPGRR